MLDKSSFLDHLEALRRTLLGNLAVMAVLLIPAGIAVHGGLPVLLKLLSALVPGCKFSYLTPLEPFFLELKLTLAAAFIAGLPAHIGLWGKFLAPALYRHEKYLILQLGGAALILFLLGASVGLGAVLPMLLRFSAGFATPEWQPVLTFSSIINLALMLLLGFGAVFELPIVILLLVRGGLVRVSTLKKQRPVILVLILAVSAVLTPPDVLSQCIMAVPAYLLFEFALLIAGHLEPPAEPENEPECGPECEPDPEEDSDAPAGEEAPLPLEPFRREPDTVYCRRKPGILQGRPRRNPIRKKNGRET